MKKFMCYKGNHSDIIRQALLKRGNWDEVILINIIKRYLKVMMKIKFYINYILFGEG